MDEQEDILLASTFDDGGEVTSVTEIGTVTRDGGLKTYDRFEDRTFMTRFGRKLQPVSVVADIAMGGVDSMKPYDHWEDTYKMVDTYKKLRIVTTYRNSNGAFLFNKESIELYGPVSTPGKLFSSNYIGPTDSKFGNTLDN